VSSPVGLVAPFGTTIADPSLRRAAVQMRRRRGRRPGGGAGRRPECSVAVASWRAQVEQPDDDLRSSAVSRASSPLPGRRRSAPRSELVAVGQPLLASTQGDMLNRASEGPRLVQANERGPPSVAAVRLMGVMGANDMPVRDSYTHRSRALTALTTTMSSRCRTATSNVRRDPGRRFPGLESRRVAGQQAAVPPADRRPVTITDLEAHDVRVRLMGDFALIHARTSYTTATGSSVRAAIRTSGPARRPLAGGQRARDALGAATRGSTAGAVDTSPSRT